MWCVCAGFHTVEHNSISWVTRFYVLSYLLFSKEKRPNYGNQSIKYGNVFSYKNYSSHLIILVSFFCIFFTIAFIQSLFSFLLLFYKNSRWYLCKETFRGCARLYVYLADYFYSVIQIYFVILLEILTVVCLYVYYICALFPYNVAFIFVSLSISFSPPFVLLCHTLLFLLYCFIFHLKTVSGIIVFLSPYSGSVSGWVSPQNRCSK